MYQSYLLKIISGTFILEYAHFTPSDPMDLVFNLQYFIIYQAKILFLLL